MVICHLKSILGVLGKEQKDIAYILNISRNTVSNFALNKTYPDIVQAYEIVTIINKWANEKGINYTWDIYSIWEQKNN